MTYLSDIFSSPFLGGMLIFLALGAAIFAYSVIGAKIARKRTILKRMSDKEFFKGFFDMFLDRFPALVAAEKKMTRSLSVIGTKMSARTITKIRIAAAGVGLLVSFMFRNWMMVVPAVFLCQIIPMGFIEVSVKRLQGAYERQILEAFQIFITEYTTTHKILDALFSTCPKVKQPLRREFERLTRNLHSGVRYEEAFTDFAERTQSKWTYIFAQMMINYFREGNDFTEHMVELTNQIGRERIVQQENDTETSSLRLVNILLNIAVPVAYIINRAINPENTRIFVETPTGRTLMLMVTLACLVSLYVGKRITNA